MQEEQCQIPTALLFILVWKHNVPSTTAACNNQLVPAVSDTCVSYLATERAGVFWMLGNFNFLHHLPQRRTITGAVFTNDPHLLGALGLRTWNKTIQWRTWIINAHIQTSPRTFSILCYSEHLPFNTRVKRPVSASKWYKWTKQPNRSQKLTTS